MALQRSTPKKLRTDGVDLAGIGTNRHIAGINPLLVASNWRSSRAARTRRGYHETICSIMPQIVLSTIDVAFARPGD